MHGVANARIEDGQKTEQNLSYLLGTQQQTCSSGVRTDGRTPDYYITPCYANNVNKACQTMPGARWRGRPRTAWMDNIKTWTGLSVEESLRTTEDRDKWRKYVHGVADARIEDG